MSSRTAGRRSSREFRASGVSTKRRDEHDRQHDEHEVAREEKPRQPLLEVVGKLHSLRECAIFLIEINEAASPLVDRLYFRPNLEIGIGDDLTLIGANMEFVYKFTRNRALNPYAGAGPALNIFMPDEGDTSTDAGFNILVGAETPKGLFFEFKIGAIDSPDFKFGVGYTWR